MADPPPVLEPVPDDAVSAVTVGLVLWLLAAIGCLLLRDQLRDHGVGWWLGACLAGLAVGVFMSVLFRERVRRIREHRGDDRADARLTG